MLSKIEFELDANLNKWAESDANLNKWADAFRRLSFKMTQSGPRLVFEPQLIFALKKIKMHKMLSNNNNNNNNNYYYYYYYYL